MTFAWRVAVVTLAVSAFSLSAYATRADATLGSPGSVDLAISKSNQFSGDVAPGGTLRYKLSVDNLEEAEDATGVTVTDSLPPSTSFVSAASSHGFCTETGGVVTCPLGELTSATSALISVSSTAPESIGDIVNLATVTANEPDPAGENNNASATTTVTIGGGGGAGGPAPLPAGWLTVSDLTVSPAVGATNAPVFVSLTAQNLSGGHLTYTIPVVIDGNLTSYFELDIDLDDGEAVPLGFSFTSALAGNFVVSVGSSSSGFTVEDPPPVPALTTSGAIALLVLLSLAASARIRSAARR